MSRQTLITLIIGIIILIVAGLFIFGLVPAPSGSQSASAACTPLAKPKTTKTADGLQIDVYSSCSTQAVKSGDTVEITYTGKLTDGKVFDSTDNHGGTPFETQIGTGQVIKGWDEGIVGMKIGEKRRLTIPSSLGYGDAGSPPTIPPKATLIFDVQLVGIK